MDLPPAVTLTHPEPDYPVLEVDHPSCRARLALHGAHVMSWQPAAAAEPVLYLSPDAVLREGKAIRGGIPICWPWFNAHPHDPGQPSHGFARNRFWTFGEAETDADGVRLTLEMAHAGYAATASFRFGKALRVELHSRNEGDSALPVAGALHSYLRVGDVTKARVEGLDGADYLDTVGEPATRRQEGAVRIDGETDRIYESPSTARLVDDSLGRVIVVEKEGSTSTVVWNPWSEKAAALGDLPDDGYRGFLCVEAAIANHRAVTLGPGRSHTLATTLRVAAD